MIQYYRNVNWDAALQDLETNETGLVIQCQKITTGAPTATAGKFVAGALVQNIVSGVVYQNTGSTASPVFAAMAAGSGITALTGDVTASGTGSVAATIANSAVTTAKIAANAVDGTKIALTSQATGDMMYYDGTDWVVIAAGTVGQVLTMAGGIPTWA